MSDTPRTDAFYDRHEFECGSTSTKLVELEESIRFARQLERELDSYKAAWHGHVMHISCATGGCQLNAAPQALTSSSGSLPDDDRVLPAVAAPDFDCHYDGDFNACDKEMCHREQVCRRRS